MPPALDELDIISPKRLRPREGWDGFFPYYAGFPEAFATTLLKSAGLKAGATVLDPWNGSGTTTYAASRLNIQSVGIDINPVMVVISRARMLPASEADALLPLANDLVKQSKGSKKALSLEDPLNEWFSKDAAIAIRSLEYRIRATLVGEATVSSIGVKFERMACIAATFYVALFSVCRQLLVDFRSSNPTWIKVPKVENRVSIGDDALYQMYISSVSGMARALGRRDEKVRVTAPSAILLGDTAAGCKIEHKVDFVLSSPPYCTRIDYSSATRIEQAVMGPLVADTHKELGRRMIGSVRVPLEKIEISPNWGSICEKFLASVYEHGSKASKTYYYKTHLDYYHKMYNSLASISSSVVDNGGVVLVVQDSFYKDIHNKASDIIAEMASNVGLEIISRKKFKASTSMIRLNKYNSVYNRDSSVYESVLVFRKAA